MLHTPCCTRRITRLSARASLHASARPSLRAYVCTCTCTCGAQVKSTLGEHSITTLEALSAPEPCCIELLQIFEALIRRRVSNLSHAPFSDHFIDVIVRLFSFRSSPRVRAYTTSVIAWCARCPRARAHLFDGRYDGATMKPVHTALKDYARLLHIPEDQWTVDPRDPRYQAETGIVLSDAGLHAGIFGVHLTR